jgi:Leucine-rich repeat (LRR) protein
VIKSEKNRNNCLTISNFHRTFVALLAITVARIDGFDLKCNKRNDSFFSYVSGSGVYALNLYIVNRGATITSVNGRSLNAFKSSDLVWVSIDRQVVHFIPDNLGAVLPNIQALEISYCSLKEVQQKDFAQFKKLRGLHLYGNDIEHLPGDLFEKNLDIVFINIGRNKLKSIGHNLLTPLTKLEGLTVSSNPCVDNGITFKGGISEDIKTLVANCAEPISALKHHETVDAFQKQLRTLQATLAEVFSRNQRHEVSSVNCKQQLDEATARNKQLDVSSANCKQQLDEATGRNKQLEVSSANCKQQLDEATARNKQLEVSSANCKQQLQSRDKINDALARFIFVSSSTSPNVSSPAIGAKCRVNATEKLCELIDFFVELPETKLEKVVDESRRQIDPETIEKLVIVDQQAVFLPSNLGQKFSNLTKLTVANCGFFLMTSDSFANLTLLTSLELNHNKLRQIPQQCFTDNRNLRSLSFAYNNIEIIHDDAFVSLNNLVDLNLQNNLLSSLQANLFSNLILLETLKLQNNNINVIESKLFFNLSKLVRVDISGELS